MPFFADFELDAPTIPGQNEILRRVLVDQYDAAVALPTPTLRVKVIEPKAQHKLTVILCHDRDGQDPDPRRLFGHSSNHRNNADKFANQFLRLGHPYQLLIHEHLPEVKWVFPYAPTMYSVREGIRKTQWFDMWDMRQPNRRPELQLGGLEGSAAMIQQLVENEVASVEGFTHKNIILGGLGQGAVASLCALFSGNQQHGGFISIAGWLPERLYELRGSGGPRALDTDMFVTYNEDDNEIDQDAAAAMYGSLEGAEFGRVEEAVFSHGGHALNADEALSDNGVNQLIDWIDERMVETL